MSKTQLVRRFIASVLFISLTTASFPHSAAARIVDAATNPAIESNVIEALPVRHASYWGQEIRGLTSHPAFTRNQTANADKTRLLTGLAEFVQKVQNGEPETLRGVYLKGLFALPVMQQGDKGAAFVSSVDGALTEFGMAAQFGNVGLLAHNYLSGRLFFDIQPEQLVVLVFGDGRLEYYRISEIKEYQALSPNSPYSSFRDLDSNQSLDAAGLFSRVYRGERHVTFQTCIAQDGVSSWGRIFIIALPVYDAATELAAE